MLVTPKTDRILRKLESSTSRARGIAVFSMVIRARGQTCSNCASTPTTPAWKLSSCKADTMNPPGSLSPKSTVSCNPWAKPHPAKYQPPRSSAGARRLNGTNTYEARATHPDHGSHHPRGDIRGRLLDRSRRAFVLCGKEGTPSRQGRADRLERPFRFTGSRHEVVVPRL